MRLFVVLSLPRSGTSLLAKVLSRMGADLPDDQVAPHPEHNPEGFFESTALLGLRVQLEERLGINFSFPASWSEPNWAAVLASGALDDLAAQAQALFEPYRQRGTKALVFKDPRTTALLPFWDQVFRRSDMDVEWIVAVRDPAAVSRSVHRFNSLSPAMAQLIWLETYTRLFSFLRDKQSIVVSYERWFGGEDQARVLHQALWGEPAAEEVLERLRADIKPSLNHAPAPASPTSPSNRIARDLHAWAAALPVRNDGLPQDPALVQAEAFLGCLREVGAILHPEAYQEMMDFDRREREWLDKIAALESRLAEMSQAANEHGAPHAA